MQNLKLQLNNDNGSNDQSLLIDKYSGDISVVSALSYNSVKGFSCHNDGDFWACEDDDDRFSQITPTSGVMTEVQMPMTGGGNIASLAALVLDANRMMGRVFDDVNINGDDDSEAAIVGVTVILYDDVNTNQILDGPDIPIQSTETDANGEYIFYCATTADLITTIDLGTLPSGYSLTTDNIEIAAFTDAVNFGETNSENDFGAASGTDCDADGIPDFIEGGGDLDGDGVQNQCDIDSDNDGILDRVEGTDDKDGDGIPNYHDFDSDNDGIPDAIEANSGAPPSGYNSATGRIHGLDTDCDGLLNHIDNDPLVIYGYGSTSKLPNPDTDKDGLSDYKDLDSDNDGILDNIEAGGSDSNCDGRVDGFTDVNGDGYHDALTTSPLPITNSDASYETTYGHSLKPNYIDMDSDADGIDDTKEGLATCGIDVPCYSIPSQVIDSDWDGILNHWDITNGGSCIDPYDKDTDGNPDYTDLDTDNDGLPDVIEGNDANYDDVADSSPSGNDVDENGIDDTFDNVCTGTSMLNIGAPYYGEQRVSDGNMNVSDSDLELVNDGSTNQIVGVQFSSVNIPKSATISKAYIQFECDEISTGALTITIHGEDIDNPLPFTTTASDISSRVRTTASETWSPADWNTVDERGGNQRTVEIKSIVQEIVKRTGWTPANSMTFIFSGASGTRTAKTNPTLYVEFPGVMYACGSNVPTQDEDGDGEDDWRDDFNDDGPPLPIELLSFTADVIDENVEIKWETASEINNDYYTVERSQNGENFETLAIVKGAGNSNQLLKYLTIDKDPFAGTSYYRLKQTDFNGIIRYSNIVSVNITKSIKAISLYPNPVTSNVVAVKLSGYDNSEDISINIRNAYGLMIYNRIIHGQEGSILELPIKEIVKSSGIYLITIVSDDSIISKKLIVN